MRTIVTGPTDLDLPAAESTAQGEHAPAPDAAPPGRTADRELIERIIAEFEIAVRHIRCAAAERLVRQGVSMTHLHILWHLEAHGELAMNRIAELVGVSMSNATGLIDRMEERGLVERVRLTDDRRVVHVHPTSRGIDVLREIEVLRSDLMETVLARLDDEQLGRLARSITDIRNVLVTELSAVGGDSATCHHAPRTPGASMNEEIPAHDGRPDPRRRGRGDADPGR